MLNKAAKNGKLLVTGIAACVDPSIVILSAAAADGAVHASEEWLSTKPDLQHLATQIDKAFATEIAKPSYNKPDGIRILLPQMLEASFAIGDTLTEGNLDAGLIIEKMKATLTDPEHIKPENLDAFDRAVRPLLASALNDRDLVAVLNPAIQRKLLKDASETKAAMRKLTTGQSDSIPLNDMIKLASGFGEHTVKDRPSLTIFLGKKAEEYEALKAQVDAIPENMQRLANLKAAAQDAIARVDLDEVENLMSMVHEAELEEAAKSAEIRADNALLRGDTAKAYALLNSSADSFGAVDKPEPARRRLRFAHKLFQHGLRYGGDSLVVAASMLTRALELLEEGSYDWLKGQINLAVALQEQAIRADGPKSDELLTEAVTRHRIVLEVCTREKNPVLWSVTQNNLGNTLQRQGTRIEGTMGANLVAQAVDAYRAALEVRTRDAEPIRWAMTQNNLGAALAYQGSRTEAAEGLNLLARAATAYREALSVRTRDANLVQWAETKNNLAIAFKDQGVRTLGANGKDLLATAITSYQTVLEARIRDVDPIGWAETQENLALAQVAIADHDTCTNPKPPLTAALEAVENALTVFDPEHLSYNYAKASRLRDEIRARLDALQ
ncbi:MAG: hypothetical protein AAF943_18080 [Pseudomonadota bacterium]